MMIIVIAIVSEIVTKKRARWARRWSSFDGVLVANATTTQSDLEQLILEIVTKKRASFDGVLVANAFATTTTAMTTSIVKGRARRGSAPGSRTKIAAATTSKSSSASTMLITIK